MDRQIKAGNDGNDRGTEYQEPSVKNGQVRMDGSRNMIPIAIYRCKITTCFSACHLSYYSSGTSLPLSPKTIIVCVFRASG